MKVRTIEKSLGKQIDYLIRITWKMRFLDRLKIAKRIIFSEVKK